MIKKTDSGHVVLNGRGDVVSPPLPTRSHAEQAEHQIARVRGADFYKPAGGRPGEVGGLQQGIPLIQGESDNGGRGTAD